jgi:fructosamine-3-kinase
MLERSIFLPVVEASLKKHFQEDIVISETEQIQGGCINACYSIATNAGKFFLKINEAKKYSEMFASEAKALRLIASHVAGFTTNVITQFEHENHQYLILNFIERGSRRSNFWEYFAQQLAGLHKNTSENFGLDHANYIGSVKQINTWHKTFSDFFRTCRLEPLLKNCIHLKLLPSSLAKHFDNLCKKFTNIIPEERPAFIHGDLWAGNFIIDAKGHARIIDPAIAFSHRECDLAMTKLFGGFDAAFYEAYHQHFPLENAFSERIAIYNLYPLLVHTMLFGGGYAQQVTHILRKY